MATTADNRFALATIRRLMRLLGAHPAHVNSPIALAGAAQLTRDRIRRNGIDVRLIERGDGPPAVLAGHGPVAVICYLDDADANAQQHAGQPPLFQDNVVFAPGIVRKGGVAAALAYLLEEPNAASLITLVVETDRHQGSHTLAACLADHSMRLRFALWETVDLPIDTPALFHSACGALTVRVLLTTRNRAIESLYGGVVPDLGFSLVQALSTLKSPEQEIRLADFYEQASLPQTGDLATLNGSAARIADWVNRSAGVSENLPAAHVAMGIFVAPSLSIRELRVDDERPYLPRAAQAVVELNLVPGQSVESVLRELAEHFAEKLPQAIIEPLQVREPADGGADLDDLRALCPRVFGAAPGPNPAGLLSSFGIPNIGYAIVSREQPDELGQISLSRVQEGAALIAKVVEEVTRQLSAEHA